MIEIKFKSFYLFIFYINCYFSSKSTLFNFCFLFSNGIIINCREARICYEPFKKKKKCCWGLQAFQVLEMSYCHNGLPLIFTWS